MNRAILLFALAAAACAPAPAPAPVSPNVPAPAPATSAARAPGQPACTGCTADNAAVWKPVQAQLEAYNASDLAAFLAPYDPSIEIRDLDTGAVLMRGLDAMHARYEQAFRTPRHVDVATRIVTGEYVVDREDAVFGADKRQADVAAIYRVRNGKIDRVWFTRRHFAPGSAPVTALVGATVVRSHRSGADAAIADAVVIVEDDRIRDIGRAADVKIPAGAKVVDLKGKWIAPGLVDSHVHFFQSGGLYTRPDAIDLRKRVPYEEERKRIDARLPFTFRTWLRSGVTSVADDGGSFWLFKVRDQARASREAPRVKIAGPLLSTHDLPNVHRMDLDDPPIYPVKTVEEARALARRELALEPDYFKVWFIHLKGDDLAAQEALAKAGADEAHARGVRVMVHATELDTAKAAMRADADILVHSVDDREVDEEFLTLARARHVVYIPTLYVVAGYVETFSTTWKATDAETKLGDPEIIKSLGEMATIPASELPKDFAKIIAKRADRAREEAKTMAKNLVRVRDAGVTIALGTDAGNIGTLHGPSVFREMARMKDAGMTPLEVLRAATQGGAIVLGMEKELGMEPGRLADLVVLDHDPLAAVPTGTDVALVVKGGVVMDPSELAK